jgi:hypothetical protein
MKSSLLWTELALNGCCGHVLVKAFVFTAWYMPGASALQSSKKARNRALECYLQKLYAYYLLPLYIQQMPMVRGLKLVSL